MSQPESRLSGSIQSALKNKGAWCYKVWGNSLTPSGIPDIIGVYRGQFIAVETKIPATGRLEPMQRYRISRIRARGGMVVVARSCADALQMLYHLDSGIHREDCLIENRACPYLTNKDDE